MKGTCCTSKNCEVLASKLVKPKNSPHTSVMEGLKIYENVLQMIKKYSNDECFFREAKQAHLSGKILFGKQRQDSVETIWNNLEKNLKQVRVEIGDLNQIILGSIKSMMQQMQKLEVAKKSRRMAIELLHTMAVKKCRSKEKQLVASGGTPVEKKELEEVRLNLKQMLNINFFLVKMNQRHSAGFSFFGVTAKFKSRENTFFKKKELVVEIQKNIQENTNSLVLLRKKNEEKKSLYDALAAKTFTAGQAFKTFVITILKRKCAVVLQDLGILEKDLSAIRASLLLKPAAVVPVKSNKKPLLLAQVRVQEFAVAGPNSDCYYQKYGRPAVLSELDSSDSDSDKEVAAEPDEDWFYQESDSDSASDSEVVEEPSRRHQHNNNNDKDCSIFYGEKTNNRAQQEAYYSRLVAHKRPRSTPIFVLPNAKRVKTHNIHEVFQSLLTLVDETFPTHDEAETTTTNNSTNTGLTKLDYDVLNYKVDKINEELLESYVDVYPNLSASMRAKVSEVFAKANDIQHFRRRHQLMQRRKIKKKQEKEVCNSSEDDAECAYDSDLSCTSSDDDDDDDEETMNELSNLWDMDSVTRTERLTSVLYDSDNEENLILPSDVATTEQIVEPFKKKPAFLQWEQGDPNDGEVLDPVIDMVSSSINLPSMMPYNGLIFNRFCKVCCRVVEWPDMDCICTDYRGLKRSQCKDGLFFPTLRMKNAWVILKRNLRRSREHKHKTAWRLWRLCQRDLLLWGHPVLRTKREYDNDPRVGNHVLNFMRFVFANYTDKRYGTNDCVVCGDVLDMNRAFNFCNTCKAWKPFQAIWKDVQKEVRPKNPKAISRQHRLAHKHNRELKKKAEKRQKKYLKTVAAAAAAAAKTTTTTTTSNTKPKIILSPETKKKIRRLARSGAGKQPQKLAYKTPKACHLSTYYNSSSSSSSSSFSNSDDDDDDDENEDADPNNRYAVPSSAYSNLLPSLIPVNPLDVISFQIPSPPPPLPNIEIPPINPEIDSTTNSVNDYIDDAMAMDFN